MGAFRNEDPKKQGNVFFMDSCAKVRLKDKRVYSNGNKLGET